MKMDGQQLLTQLGLTVRTDGPSGRYPTAHEGPANGYAYFAAPLDGKIRFGIQGVPIRPLNGMVLDKLSRHGFVPTNKLWETCILIDDLSPASLNVARETMALLQRELGGRSPDSTLEGVSLALLEDAFAEFCSIIEQLSGKPFVRFDEGLPAAWEDYKPKLRKLALMRLDAQAWSPEQTGSGAILAAVINAIEIDKSSTSVIANNLVGWQNRWGHANRDHRRMIEASAPGGDPRALERALFDLYRGDGARSLVFGRLAELLDAKYPLLAYLFFLADDQQFMPIQPTTFDRAFARIGVPLQTRRSCSWENYAAYNAVLADVRDWLRRKPELADTRLVDAHSFLWMLIKAGDDLAERESGKATRGPQSGDGYVYGGRDISIYDMAKSVRDTVKSADGSTVERTKKVKEQRMTDQQLEEEIRHLLDVQSDRCALTGLRLQYSGQVEDKQLIPSLDRKDSNGHYERGNLQVVCKFINFWKSDQENDEFLRLLALVRGEE